MKRAVSISLGSPSRDKRVMVNFNGVDIQIERIGTGGNVDLAKNLFLDLDGKADALSLGGIDLYVSLDSHDYPVRNALKLVKSVHHTPVVDGRTLKYVLEKRIFELAKPLSGDVGRFQKVFMPFSVDRIGLAEAVSSIAEQVIFGDLMFVLGFPYPIRGLKQLKRLIRLLMPIMGFLPLSVLFPPGVKDEGFHPKYSHLWESADLIAGDMHYIQKYGCDNLSGKCVITNTTTEENIAMLKKRGIHWVMTTTPRYEGRSFGINVMEAVLTAYAGKERALDSLELNTLIDELKLRPTFEVLNPK